MNNYQLPDFLQEDHKQKFLSHIEKILPAHITPDMAWKSALRAYSENNFLGKCTPESVFSAILQGFQLGLEPGSLLGHCYLIPKYSSKTRSYSCTFMLGYKGMIQLLYNYAGIEDIQCEVVHENDVFEYELGFNRTLKHIKAAKNRGEMIAVYFIGERAGGRPMLEVMSKEEIDEIRDLSHESDISPWKKHYNEMAKKTVIRRAFKYAKTMTTLQKAITLDEYGEANVQETEDFGQVKAVFEGLENKKPQEPEVSEKLDSPMNLETRELCLQLLSLCQEKNVSVEEFTAFHHIKSAQPETVLQAIEKFDELYYALVADKKRKEIKEGPLASNTDELFYDDVNLGLEEGEI